MVVLYELDSRWTMDNRGGLVMPQKYLAFPQGGSTGKYSQGEYSPHYSIKQPSDPADRAELQKNGSVSCKVAIESHRWDYNQSPAQLITEVDYEDFVFVLNEPMEIRMEYVGRGYRENVTFKHPNGKEVNVSMSSFFNDVAENMRDGVIDGWWQWTKRGGAGWKLLYLGVDKP